MKNETSTSPSPASSPSVPVDRRLVLYRMIRVVVLAVIVAIFCKIFIFDSYLIATTHMEPAILKGDRLIVSRLCAAPFLHAIFPPRRNSAVIFEHPQALSSNGCLRITGLPGETISISQGAVVLPQNKTLKRHTLPDSANALPPSFSPRDHLDSVRIPFRGMVVALDSVSNRDFLFAAACIRRENRAGMYTVHSFLHMNDSLSNDFYIPDFALYRGPFDKIPAEHYDNWFFWERLADYLAVTYPAKKFTIRFSLERNGQAVSRYTFRRNAYFLVADDWREGFDSRYFGPVSAAALKGSVMYVLWSFNPRKKGLTGFRPTRTCRILFQ